MGRERGELLWFLCLANSSVIVTVIAGDRTVVLAGSLYSHQGMCQYVQEKDVR